MKDFKTYLTREKFVLYDPELGEEDESATTALSNRMHVHLNNPKKKTSENFVIRAHNMHSCARFAARILNSFNSDGPLLTRQIPFDWDHAWNAIVNDYEYAFNPDRWVCVYNNGEILYQKGQHHDFLDVIEACDHINDKDYDYAVPIAEKEFQRISGEAVGIRYDANVALVIDFSSDKGYCGIILRAADKVTKFNFLVAKKTDRDINVAQCIASAAAFLEGIQLAFMTGMNIEKIRVGIIKRLTKEEKQNREAKRRLTRLDAEIANMENELIVNYRPEKPDFYAIQADAEAIAQKMFAKKKPATPRSKSAKNH